MENNQLEVVGVTGTSAKEVYLKWTINNFHNIARSSATFSSPEFEIMLYTDCTKWNIRLSPICSDHWSRPPYSYASIHLLKATSRKIFVDVDLKLFNSLGENLDSLTITKAELENNLSYKQNSKICWLDNIILHKIAHDNKVILHINLKAFLNNHPATMSELPISNSKSSASNSSISNSSDSNKKSSIKPDKPSYTTLFQSKLMPSIIEDFAKLRVNGELSDLTISVRGKEFCAHKIILAARSPVFSTMFKQEMKEANSGKVEIEDIEPEVFEEFLKFIYSGKGDINKNACELLAAADKYDVQDLKAFCENALIKDLSKENCFKTLNLGDLYSAHNLKKEAINFIVSNNCISDETGLAQIANLELSKELIKAFVNQKK